MAEQRIHILYLDDYHAGDVHFLQSLARALGKRSSKRAPILVHGSAEHAERMLESNGIFRRRENGIIQIESSDEHALVERAARQLNQKVVAILTDAVVSSVGIIGTQRRTLVVDGSRISANGGEWLGDLTSKGVVPVVAALARDTDSGGTGEIPVSDAIAALADTLTGLSPEVVFFTKTNLPGIMDEGRTIPEIASSHVKVRDAIPDDPGMQRVLAHGLPVLLSNTTRFADADGPVGSRILPNDVPS